jgi:hypothetical protein
VDKQTVLEGIGALLIILLKGTIKQGWEQFQKSPFLENFLVWITGGAYHKKKREAAIKAQQLIQEREEETKRQLVESERSDGIMGLLDEMRIRNGFDRVTLSKLTYTGGFFPANPTLEDFEKISITIPYESVARGIATIADEWQNRSGRKYALIFQKLYHDPRGYITIGPTDTDDLTMLMNMHHVIWSMRFRMSKNSTIFDGMITVSIMFGQPPGYEEIERMTKDCFILTNMVQELLTNT